MGFDKETGAAAGKKSSRRGVPNVITSDVRKVLKGVIAAQIEELPDLLNEMNPKERAELIIKLLPFVVPRVENVPSTEGEGVWS